MFFNGCAEDKDKMTTTELKNRLNDTSLVVLDVRTPEELQGPLGKIDGVINIPVQELDNRADELNKYKDKEIAIICRSGHRSGIAQKILKEKGFKTKNVEGGMIQYRKSN